MAFKRLQLDAKKEQAALIRVMGDRMKEARELNNLTQQSAALKLGYRNSSKLAKVENATDTNSIPLWLILRAAKFYGVSTDYLFGLNADWEQSARLTIERQSGNWLNEQWEKLRRRDLEVLQKFYARLEALDVTISNQFRLVKDLKEALISFSALNPKYENEMRGSAKLSSVIERLERSSEVAEAKLRKFRKECELANATNETLQLPLFEEEDK